MEQKYKKGLRATRFFKGKERNNRYNDNVETMNKESISSSSSNKNNWKSVLRDLRSYQAKQISMKE